LIQNDHETAEQRLEWASRTNPRAAGGFFFLGYVAWSGGNDKEAQRLLAKASKARGEEWKPEGATAEGDVKHQMHTEYTPLGRFWREWDGGLDPGTSYATLDAYLTQHPMRNNRSRAGVERIQKQVCLRIRDVTRNFSRGQKTHAATVSSPVPREYERVAVHR